MITPENLIRASDAIVVNLTDREKPVSGEKYDLQDFAHTLDGAL